MSTATFVVLLVLGIFSIAGSGSLNMAVSTRAARRCYS